MKKELIDQVREFLIDYVTDEATADIIISELLSPYGNVYSFPYDDMEGRREVEQTDYLDYLIDDVAVPVCVVMIR